MGRVFFNTRKNLHALDGAYTMLESDSGKTFMLSATGGTVAITMLPIASIVEGWNCKFVVDENTPSNAITIGAGSAIIDMVMKDAGGNASNSYAECLSAIDDAVTTS